jgi:hypothetical protein
MASPFVAALAIGAALITACDVSQKTPQTGSAPSVTAPAVGIAGPVTVGRDLQVPGAAMTPGATVGERSIRLYGPGVSRKRQTRV